MIDKNAIKRRIETAGEAGRIAANEAKKQGKSPDEIKKARRIAKRDHQHLYPSNHMEHWNGSQICVIDTETTGLEPYYHELVQICILPLDANLDVRKDVMPFYINLKPDYPERAHDQALKINKLNLANLSLTGHCREAAKDMLTDWKDKLGLPVTKYGNPMKIIPLGHNYGAFDKNFIASWLGGELYEELFHYHYRDSMAAALYLNDRAAIHGNVVEFNKVGLTWLCKKLNIVNERAHDALSDCVATGRVYKELCRRGMF